MTADTADTALSLSRYLEFDRDEWRALRAATPLSLDEADLERLRGINENISLAEVSDVYLPLSRLLNLFVAASQNLHQVTDLFLGKLAAPSPYVIGIAGSVAVGKSTTARILQAVLSRWPDHPAVDLVTTDGFLLPNRILEERGLMEKKGFPESYDLRRLLQFMADLKSGLPEVRAPLYSHVSYDIVPDEYQCVRQPDIVIVEGLNVLQAANVPGREARVVVSDFFDFSIYVDAEEADIEEWYVERFLTLCETVFRDDNSYFHRFAALDHDQAVATARQIWRGINGINLSQNILPTRERAHLVLSKARDHTVHHVRLRRL